MKVVAGVNMTVEDLFHIVDSGQQVIAEACMPDGMRAVIERQADKGEPYRMKIQARKTNGLWVTQPDFTRTFKSGEQVSEYMVANYWYPEDFKVG